MCLEPKMTTHTKDSIQVIGPAVQVGIPPTPTAPSITYKITEWNLKASLQPVWKSTWIIPQRLPHPEISTASKNLNFCHPWRNVAPVNQRLKKKMESAPGDVGRLYSSFTWFDTSFQWCRFWMPSVASLGSMHPSHYTHPFEWTFFSSTRKLSWQYLPTGQQSFEHQPQLWNSCCPSLQEYHCLHK